jgi:hypothetical protein
MMRNSLPRGRKASRTQAETWQGFKDARDGLKFPREYDSWERRLQENYERGRLVYHNIVLARLDTKLNPMTFRTAREQAIKLVGAATGGPRPEHTRMQL